MPLLLRSPADLTPAEWRALYEGFDAPIARLDCGKKCAPHNPGGKPFCCDIRHAVPAAFASEWTYFQAATDLWHRYRPVPDSDLPAGMVSLACLGPARCRRKFRALSCRAFPFFPYITSDYRVIGLDFESDNGFVGHEMIRE